MKIVQKTIRVLLNWQFLIPTLFAALLPTKPGAQDTHNILQKNFPAHAPPL